MGLSKLFMRAGQIGQMEDLRSRCIRSATVIQRHTRGLVARRRFRRLKAAAVRTQVRVRAVVTNLALRFADGLIGRALGHACLREKEDERVAH